MDFPLLMKMDARAVQNVHTIIEGNNAQQTPNYNITVEDLYNYHGIIIIRHSLNT